MIKTSKSGVSIMRSGVVETESDDATKVFLPHKCGISDQGL